MSESRPERRNESEKSRRMRRLRRRRRKQKLERRRSLVLSVVMFLLLAGILFYIGAKVVDQAESGGTRAVNGNPGGGSDSSALSSGEDEQLSDQVIVLDPGHGGNDPGAVATAASGEIYEKDLNLSIALLTESLLENAGCTVLLTRSTDEYVSLEDRASFANDHNAALFVSIHQNILEDDTETNGAETWYWDGSAQGLNLAACLQSSLVQYTAAANLGAKSSTGLYVLHHTEAVSILVECGYMSCPSELARLMDSNGQQEIAEGICDGILDYLDAE